MRTKLVLLVLLVAFAALAFPVGPAAGRPGPRPHLRAATHATKPIPAADLVPKTAATLPASAYPWVQPAWQTVDGVTVVTAPRTVSSVSTQPPAWVFSH